MYFKTPLADFMRQTSPELFFIYRAKLRKEKTRFDKESAYHSQTALEVHRVRDLLLEYFSRGDYKGSGLGLMDFQIDFDGAKKKLVEVQKERTPEEIEFDSMAGLAFWAATLRTDFKEASPKV